MHKIRFPTGLCLRHRWGGSSQLRPGHLITYLCAGPTVDCQVPSVHLVMPGGHETHSRRREAGSSPVLTAAMRPHSTITLATYHLPLHWSARRDIVKCP